MDARDFRRRLQLLKLNEEFTPEERLSLLEEVIEELLEREEEA